MKGILEFALPEDQHEFEVAQAAHRYREAIVDLDNYLRAQVKYCELDEAHAAVFQLVRDKLHELTRGLSL